MPWLENVNAIRGHLNRITVVSQNEDEESPLRRCISPGTTKNTTTDLHSEELSKLMAYNRTEINLWAI